MRNLCETPRSPRLCVGKKLNAEPQSTPRNAEISFNPQSAIGNRQSAGGGAFGSWEQVGMALETHTLLTHQPQRCEIEYRAIGVNSAGISVPSNTAAVVL